jgi:hypothetical protein
MKARSSAPILTALAAIAFGAGALASSDAPATTRIEDRAAFERLIGNSGMSLQWISWTNKKRGKIDASYRNKLLHLKGEQRLTDGTGGVSIDGAVSRVGKTEFILNGTIKIENTPDIGRVCEKTGEWRFAITQNRKYWRLREFEWCDELTDYIDIYF